MSQNKYAKKIDVGLNCTGNYV